MVQQVAICVLGVANCVLLVLARYGNRISKSRHAQSFCKYAEFRDTVQLFRQQTRVTRYNRVNDMHYTISHQRVRLDNGSTLIEDNFTRRTIAGHGDTEHRADGSATATHVNGSHSLIGMQMIEDDVTTETVILKQVVKSRA